MKAGEVLGGRFEIERLAKAGGMGAIYRAVDREDGSAVAVKYLAGVSDQVSGYFTREARILAEVRHPAVVAYRAHGRSDDGTMWLAMEWLEGQDLEERMRAERIGVGGAVRVVRQAAEALGAAHAAGIVHRDIKPSNLFLVNGDLGSVKLLDFGIARSREATRPATRTGVLLGTPGYMAPEQALGAKVLTPAADVFALGCVFFECLTGEPAFSGEHVMVVLAKILLGHTPRARALKKSIPAALDHLLSRMLSKEPSQRPQDGREVASALAALERAGVDFDVPPSVRPAASALRADRGEPDADADRARARPFDDTAPLELPHLAGGNRAALPLFASHAPSAVSTPPQSTFVGRERELDVLAALYGDSVWSPRARVAIVTAPSGFGKSRVVRELVARVAAHEQPAEVWSARGDAMSKGSPFAMIGRLLRSAAHIEGGDSAATQRDKLMARIARSVATAEVARVAHFLGELARVRFRTMDSPSAIAAAQDARLMGAQIRRAFEDFVAAETEAHPLVIVLEDLDDGDRPSVEVIEAARRSLADNPLFLLVTGRPALREAAGLFGDRNVSFVELAGLTRPAAEALVREATSISGDGDTPDLDAYIEASGGNAFHLKELARSRSLSPRDSVTAEGVAAAVFARLPEMAQRVLSAAAVLGNVFWEGALTEVLAGGTSGSEITSLFEMRSALSLVCEADILRPVELRPFPRQNDYAFRHDLLRQAAYDAIPAETKAILHERAGQWLERTGEADAGALAEHFRLAGDTARAAGYAARAAELALEGGDADSVLSWADRALTLGAPSVKADPSRGGDLFGSVRLLQAEAFKLKNDSAEVLRYATDAMARLPRGSALWYSAASEIGQAASALGDHARLEQAYKDLLLAPLDGMSAPHAVAVARMAMLLLQAGRHALADLAYRDLSHVPASVASDPSVAAAMHRATATRALYQGDIGTGLTEFAASAKAFADVGDVLSAAQQRANVGFLYASLGEYAEAERALRESLATASRFGLVDLAAFVKHNLGLALGRQGRIEEARRLELEAIDAYHREGNRRLEGGSRIYLAGILAAAGDLTGAEEHAQEAIGLTSAFPPIQAHALATLGDIWLLAGRARDAAQPAEEAMRLLEDLGGIEDGEALVRLVHAVALAQLGHHHAARGAIAKARDQLLTRADRISSPIWRTSFLTRVPDNARTLTLARQWKATGRA